MRYMFWVAVDRRSGNLDFEEFRLALEQLDITEDAHRLMAILDMDQNGKISCLGPSNTSCLSV